MPRGRARTSPRELRRYFREQTRSTTDGGTRCGGCRRREILRIGARDICLGTPTQRIMEELSDLADGVIAAALERC